MISGCVTLSEAWDILDNRFGDYQALASLILKEIREYPKVPEGNPYQYVTFIETVQRSLCDMKRIQQEKRIANPTVVGLIEDVLPNSALTEWRREVIKNSIVRLTFS